MAKVLELESCAEPIDSLTGKSPIDVAEQKKSDIEKMLESTIRKSYVLGLSNGVKAMCVSFLAEMKKDENLNPQKQLIKLRKMCMGNIKNQDNTIQNAATITETTTNTEKENGDNV